MCILFIYSQLMKTLISSRFFITKKKLQNVKVKLPWTSLVLLFESGYRMNFWRWRAETKGLCTKPPSSRTVDFHLESTNHKNRWEDLLFQCASVFCFKLILAHGKHNLFGKHLLSQGGEEGMSWEDLAASAPAACYPEVLEELLWGLSLLPRTEIFVGS